MRNRPPPARINDRPESRFRGLVGADDYGQQITGQGRIRLGLEADNVLGAYESYGVSYVGSRPAAALQKLMPKINRAS